MPTAVTSETQQARNQEACAKAAKNLSAVIHAAYGPAPSARAMGSVGLQVVGAIKLLLSTPGGGHTYTTRFYTDSQGRVRPWGHRTPHTASAPGKPPAVDTGLLRSSYTFQVGSAVAGAYVDVGTSIKYAPFLEFGTVRMKPRPHLRPAIVTVQKDIGKTVARDIGNALRQAVSAIGGTVGAGGLV